MATLWLKAREVRRKGCCLTAEAVTRIPKVMLPLVFDHIRSFIDALPLPQGSWLCGLLDRSVVTQHGLDLEPLQVISINRPFGLCVIAVKNHRPQESQTTKCTVRFLSVTLLCSSHRNLTEED